ncbi:MAG: malic enzyme-like NAD(P)-binding protein [Trebonia sp.]
MLYYALLTEHLAELLPIVYDPGDIARSLATLEPGPDDVDLIVCTDAEEILGIGDWGVGGIQIAVGTNNETLLNDPLYLGNRHARVRGAAYDAFIGKYLGTVSSLFPNALLDAVRHVRPTVLLGTSTVHGAFTREVIETMSAATDRPVIFPISNPTSRIEVMPADAIAWSKGKALVAVGIPVAPVEYAGVSYQIGQANNALVYPGLGLGTIVSDASKVTAGMLLAAAEAVAGQVDVSAPGAPLVPPVQNLCASSASTAVAVAEVVVADGVATVKADSWVQPVQDAMWQPVYADGAR